MEIKKSPKANLEDKRLTFVFLGLIVALAILYTAFEWTQREITEEEPQKMSVDTQHYYPNSPTV